VESYPPEISKNWRVFPYKFTHVVNAVLEPPRNEEFFTFTSLCLRQEAFCSDSLASSSTSSPVKPIVWEEESTSLISTSSPAVFFGFVSQPEYAFRTGQSQALHWRGPGAATAVRRWAIKTSPRMARGH
jgi:hypothetical protein